MYVHTCIKCITTYIRMYIHILDHGYYRVGVVCIA